ncbi:MAG: peptidyl-prolyl cis-trans isomerase [Sphingobacteriales bacterium]
MNEVPVTNETQLAISHFRRDRSFSTVKRWLREPLLHFLLIGLLLFGFYAYKNRGRGEAKSATQIVLSLDELATMEMYFESQWHRRPTPQEFQAMVEDKVKEEVLYREGLVMGLDKNDTIVKRRMAQKVQFLAEDMATAHEPSTAELKAWFEKNTDKFALPSRYSFRHVYFSPDKRGKNAQDDASNALAKIAGQREDSALIASADRFMFQDYYGDRTPSAIAKEFGPQFAVALEKIKPGSWQGPIESGFGWHLVFVDTVIPGRIPAFEEIESQAKTAWLGEQKAEAREKAYKSLRSKYTVLVPSPPDNQTASAHPPAPKQEIPTTSGGGL